MCAGMEPGLSARPPQSYNALYGTLNEVVNGPAPTCDVEEGFSAELSEFVARCAAAGLASAAPSRDPPASVGAVPCSSGCARCLNKNPKERAKYDQLLALPFITNVSCTQSAFAAWLESLAVYLVPPALVDAAAHAPASA